MAVGRVLLVVFSLVGVGLTLGVPQAAACHKDTDLCMLCEGDACETLGTLTHVALLGTVVEKSDTVLEPQAQDALATTFLGDREAVFHLVLQWDTDNHSAPAGQGDVPFEVTFAWGDNVDWQADNQTAITMMSQDSDPQEYSFGFTAPRNEDAQVSYVITAFPGTANAQSEKGTLTLQADDDHASGNFIQVFNDHWPWMLFLVALGILVGFGIAKWMTLSATRPVPLAA